MSGDKDGDALVGSLVNQFPELAACGRVHPTRRLIQKDNFGPVEDGDGEGKFLLPAQWKAFHQCVPLLFQPEAEKQLLRFGSNLRFGDAVDTGKEADILPHLEVFVKGKFLAHIADVLLHFFGLGSHIEACHARLASGGTTKPRKHTHGGGLACPVGSQETENLAPMDLEGDVVYGGEVTETLGQPFHFNHIVFVVFHPFVLQARRTEDACKAGQDAVGGIDAFYLPFVDEGDAVALARFVDDGGGSNDGDALLLQPTEHSPEFLAGHGVDAGSGFVQEEDIRFMDKGTAEGEFLLHAAGQRSGAALAERFYLPVNVAHQIIILLDGGVEDGGEEIEILLYRQVRIEGEASGHIPHPPADGFVVLHHIQAADRSRASVGKQQGGEDAEKRCLARTVRPDDAEKLTGSY